MSEPTYIEQLRAIRDQIGQQIEQIGWQAWEVQAKQEACRDPNLARLTEMAESSTPPTTHASAKST